MHKRNAGKLQARTIRGIILRGSFYDRNVSEVVSRVSRLDVMARANEIDAEISLEAIRKGLRLKEVFL